MDHCYACHQPQSEQMRHEPRGCAKSVGFPAISGISPKGPLYSRNKRDALPFVVCTHATGMKVRGSSAFAFL